MNHSARLVEFLLTLLNLGWTTTTSLVPPPPTCMPTPFLTANWSRVYLRIRSTEDVTILHRWINDPEVTQNLSLTFPVTLGKEKEYVDSAIAAFDKPFPTKQSFSICLVSTDELIGSMTLDNINWVHRTATTGAFIGPTKYRGLGYGRAAKHLLLQYAFHRLGLRKVTSSAKSNNEHSLAYQAKTGYVEAGRLRDQYWQNGQYVDSILTECHREDWEQAFKTMVSQQMNNKSPAEDNK